MSSESTPDGKEKKKPASTFDTLREYAPYLSMGFQLAAAVVLFFLLGVWADSELGTAPWLMLAGLLLGATGGFVKFFKTVAELERKNSTKE